MGNIITDLAEGAGKGLFSGIGSLAKDIRTTITGVDLAKQAEIEQKLLELEAAGDEAQNKINEIEAANPSIFVSGWRPFIGWTCGVAFAFNYIATPFLQQIIIVVGSNLKLPELDISTMMPVLMGLLGLGGLRSYEKFKGVARTK